MIASRGVLSAALVLAAASACGDGGRGSTLDGGLPPPDGGGGTDGSTSPPDAVTDADAGDQDPFPGDPQGGEFAWVVSAPGAAAPISVTADGRGNLFVVARQTGDVTLGALTVPAAAATERLVVLKLAADGKPIWGHGFGAEQLSATALAATSEGDLVVAGTFRADAMHLGDAVLASVGDTDGFVVMLDGNDGTTRWAAPVGSDHADHVAGIAAGIDGSGGDAIYVYGQLGNDILLGPRLVQAGGYLIRFDGSGGLQWATSLPGLEVGDRNALALDPQRGPVIAGEFATQLVLGDQVLTTESQPQPARNAVVAGFDVDGQVRFARQVYATAPSSSRSLAVTRGGDVYLASDTAGDATIVEDHPIWNAGPDADLMILRLTPEGHHAFSAVVAARSDNHSMQVAIDDAGAAYLVGGCNGQVDVEPELACASHRGGVIIAYTPDNAVRWATSVEPAALESAVAVPGERLIVAGQALEADVSFGGVRVPTRSLFVAALARGAPRLPSPLPPAPRIASAGLDGADDGEIRQGGTGTLVIRGAGLDRVTSARLGDVDIHVPDHGGGAADELRLAFAIPHGHALGNLALSVSTAGGAAEAPDSVRVTPVVVSPAGTSAGRGTFASPMQLCRTDWDAAQLVRYSDVLLLRDGVHTCDHGLVMPRGVTVRGESTQGTIVRGTSDLYLVNVGPAGTTVFDNQTIDRSGATSDEIASIRMGRGRLAVTDVDIIGDPGTGIWMNVGGSGSVNRFRYLQGQSSSAALAVFEGSLTARAITVDTAGTGIWLFSGALELTDSSLTTEHFALIAGRSFFHGGSRDLRVERTTFQCQQTCIQTYEASLTMVDSAIQANPNASSQFGLQMGGGMLELDRSVVHGWTSRAVSLAFGDGPVNARLDGVDIDTGGLEFDGGGVPPFHGRLTMRRSHVHGADGIAALVVFDYSGADLGTGDDPGDNRLDSSPGAPALVYNGNGPDFSIDVHGTTLNGTSYKDDVVGPASTVDYAIGAITMHF